MTDTDEIEIAALRARVAELEKNTEAILERCVALLGSGCKQDPKCGAQLSFDAFIEAGAGACGVCLTRRVAELKEVLREVRYDPQLEREYQGDPGTWVERCVGCGGRYGDGCKSDCKIHAVLDLEGRFLPRKESNGPTQ